MTSFAWPKVLEGNRSVKGVYKRTSEHNARNSSSLKKYWSDPENRAMRSAISKKVHNLPEVKERHRIARNRPEVRAKWDAAMKTLRADPNSVYYSLEYREKQRVAHDTPGYYERWFDAHDWIKTSISQKEAQNRPETKLKKRNSMLGKNAGENHPNWQGGIANLPYPFEFNEELKESIRQRDNYTCQLCGKTERENGRRLTVHHIDYDKSNCNPENLITLCIGCNTKVNYNREYWTEFFRAKLELCVIA